MPPFSRRLFIAGAATIPFSLWFNRYLKAQSVLTRYDASSPEGRAMLIKYAEAVRSMKNNGEGQPLNWIFQWYTHHVRDDTTKSSEISRVYVDPADPHRALAEEMWDTCQSHYLPPQFQKFFLPWHRMYVFFFERIVRKLCGDPGFALPYWDYSSTGPARHGVIPSQFTMKNDATFGPLFIENRNPGVNTGVPIDQGQPGNPLGLGALSECSYDVQGVKQGFCSKLDRGLHGQVHVLTGDPLNMGDVPWAANDPVFWLHHCNIDRLWAGWNRAGRQNLSDPAWLNQPFVFADENGNRVAASIKDFVDITQLGYTYERFEPVPSCPPLGPLNAAAANVQTHAIVPGGPIKLGSGPVQVSLEAPAGTEPPVPLTARVTGLKAGRHLYLVLRDLRANFQPGTLYHLYLELPAEMKIEQA